MMMGSSRLVDLSTWSTNFRNLPDMFLPGTGNSRLFWLGILRNINLRLHLCGSPQTKRRVCQLLHSCKCWPCTSPKYSTPVIHMGHVASYQTKDQRHFSSLREIHKSHRESCEGNPRFLENLVLQLRGLEHIPSFMSSG